MAPSLAEALKGLDRASDAARKERPRINYDDLIRDIGRMPVVAPGMDDLEKSMRRKAEKERAEAQRRVDDSENFKLMAGILVQMNLDREANRESQKKQAVFNTIMAIVGGVLALGGVVVPFVIEAMKGWK
ncbi:hypothetical protein GCM10009825_30550 [Arthrobacter humicola]|uniref:Uncharacterized protein n=2 Tax=Arthrobacter humicola TaxID=409291 RepID=A0ABN2ZG74_9MICC